MLGAPTYFDVPVLDFSEASQAEGSQQYYQAQDSQQYHQPEATPSTPAGSPIPAVCSSSYSPLVYQQGSGSGTSQSSQSAFDTDQFLVTDSPSIHMSVVISELGPT